MKTSFFSMKVLFVLSFMLLFGGVSIAQSNYKAKLYQKKGQRYYKKFQKAVESNNYPYTDKDMVVNLQKADINFNRALVLFSTRPKLYREEIKRIKLYLKIISYNINQIKEWRKEYSSSNG